MSGGGGDVGGVAGEVCDASDHSSRLRLDICKRETTWSR